MTSIMTQPHRVVEYTKVISPHGGKDHVIDQITNVVEYPSFEAALRAYKKLSFGPDGSCWATIEVVPPESYIDRMWGT